MSDKKEKITPEETCKHKFVRYPPKIGKLKVCTKCGFLWILGDVKFGEHSIKLSGSGNYIEANTTTAPTAPATGKIRFYATSDTDMKMKNSAGTETDLAAPGGDFYNFLTNPGLEIWQRGAGPFTASAAYTADRWSITLVGTDTLSVSQNSTTVDTGSQYSAACTFTLGTGAGATLLKQRFSLTLDNLYGILGQNVALRIRVLTSTASAVKARISTDGTGGTTTSSGFHTGGGTFENLDVTVTVPTNATYMQLEVSFNASCTAYVDNATLVIGSTAQTYYPLHPTEEWDRCQRYYERQGLDTGTNSMLGIIAYAAASGVSRLFSGTFATRKAVNPTLTKTGTFNVTNCGQPATQNGSLTNFVLYANSSAAGEVSFYTDTTDDGLRAEANP